MERIRLLVEHLMSYCGVSDKAVHVVALLLLIALTGLLAWLADGLALRIFVPLARKFTTRTKAAWDDIVFNERAVRSFCHLAPAIVVWIIMPMFFYDHPVAGNWIGRLTAAYFTLAFTRLLLTLLSNVQELDMQQSSSVRQYIHSFCGVMKILCVFIAVVVVVAILINKNPMALFAGLGATSAILMLIFKDTIEGLVAGIRLTSAEMVAVGDWITVASAGADGIVIEITLTTVKIQNFDNSVSTIPPYKLVSETFQNWKGIEQCGGRQARRTLNVDMNTVGFVSEGGYKQLVENNLIANDIPFDAKQRVTNVTLYRRHIESFLRNHKDVDSNRWLMVRQLESTAYGMALEMYFYVSETDFVKYEEIVAEIYEYCIALAPTFNIKIYQNITDIKQLNHK